MKNLITVLLLCVVFVAFSKTTIVKNVEDIKEEFSLDPVFKADHIDFNGTLIPISKFKKILPYNDTSLVFVNKWEKLVYLTDLKLKVYKFVNLKEMCDSLFRPGIEDAYIYKDTLFLSSNLQNLTKLVLPESKITSIKLDASPMASPYELFVRENGNYVITFRGLNYDTYFESFMRVSGNQQMNEDVIHWMKKEKERFAGRDFILGAEFTPKGTPVKFLYADKDYYGHDFGDNDEAYYMEQNNKEYLYFKMSKNIIVFDEKGNVLGRKEFPVKKDWFKPRKNEQNNLTACWMNNQPLVNFANCYLQESAPNDAFKMEGLIVYDETLNPKYRITLNGVAERFGYKIAVCGGNLLLYSMFKNDNNIYLFPLDKINWKKY